MFTYWCRCSLVEVSPTASTDLQTLWKYHLVTGPLMSIQFGWSRAHCHHWLANAMEKKEEKKKKRKKKKKRLRVHWCRYSLIKVLPTDSQTLYLVTGPLRPKEFGWSIAHWLANAIFGDGSTDIDTVWLKYRPLTRKRYIWWRVRWYWYSLVEVSPTDSQTLYLVMGPLMSI